MVNLLLLYIIPGTFTSHSPCSHSHWSIWPAQPLLYPDPTNYELYSLSVGMEHKFALSLLRQNYFHFKCNTVFPVKL